MGTDDLLCWHFGGDKRDRTADLLHAMQALSQLSYTPKMCAHYTDLTDYCKAGRPASTKDIETYVPTPSHARIAAPPRPLRGSVFAP